MNSETQTVKPSEDFEYYGNTIYWNDFKAVQVLHNRLMTGCGEIGWMQHLGSAYGLFDHAFLVNCGNGWVERDLFNAGVIRQATGSDISPGLLARARDGAAEIGLPAIYIEADVNTFEPDTKAYDLVVNVGAMHHVAHIDRVTRRLARMLRDRGVYASFDYVGAHRNQYSWEMWSRIIEINESLPPSFRVMLHYPHITSMLHSDPSEAVHSELQTEVMLRYFDIDQHVLLGGALAYTLLYGNRMLHAAQDEPEASALINQILEQDQAFLKARPQDNLFSFWIAKPKALPAHPAVMSRWTNEEDVREKQAIKSGGRYYPSTVLELIYEEHASLRQRLAVLSPS